MSKTDRPPITSDAKELLDVYRDMISYRIAHEAEKKAFERVEATGTKLKITESDILFAKTVILRSHDNSRKWSVRIAIALMFALLLEQLSALPELQTVAIPTLIRIYFPTLVIFLWMICFSYFFREDWL